MSTGGEPELGSGGFYGGSSGGGGSGGGGGFPGLGGLLGGGGMQAMGPGGNFGAWPSCGCSSIFIILAGCLLVCGGCLRMFGQ